MVMMNKSTDFLHKTGRDIYVTNIILTLLFQLFIVRPFLRKVFNIYSNRQMA